MDTAEKVDESCMGVNILLKAPLAQYLSQRMCVVRSVRGERVRTACGQTMSEKNVHHFLMGQLFGSSMRS